MNFGALDYDRYRWQSHLDEILVGSSKAYPITKVASVMLSQVTNGTATVQWTMAKKEKVADDTANWHAWSADDSASERGVVFDGPITFIRAVASAAQTQYHLEVREGHE